MEEETTNTFNSFTVTSYSQAVSELETGEPRLLEVDHRLVLPEGSRVQFEITSGDVIHSWALPDFGVKIDAVPGRINTLTVDFSRKGVYYGQCSELCGQNHGSMPIAIEIVSADEFREWMQKTLNLNHIQKTMG